MAVGGSKAVIQNVEALRYLAEETGEALTIGGVVDRDFKSDGEVGEIQDKTSVFVLGCHEIENLFLFPPALDAIDPSVGAENAIQRAADSMAGIWIVRRAFTRGEFRGAYLPASRNIRRVSGETNWATIAADPNVTASAWSQLQSNLTSEEQSSLETALVDAITAYTAVRETSELWKVCMGKEVLKQLPQRFGFTRASALERTIREHWRNEQVEVPDELTELRQYIRDLSPVN